MFILGCPRGKNFLNFPTYSSITNNNITSIFSIITEQKVEGSNFFILNKSVLGPGSETLRLILLIYLFIPSITDQAGVDDIYPWHSGAQGHKQQKASCNPLSMPMNVH